VATSKVVRYEDIESVSLDTDLRLDFWSYKSWGMALDNIWWALEVGRGLSSATNIVIKLKDSSIRCGFTGTRNTVQIICQQMRANYERLTRLDEQSSIVFSSIQPKFESHVGLLPVYVPTHAPK